MRALAPRRIADDVIEIEVASSAHAQLLARQIRSLDMAEEVVAGLRSVSLSFKPMEFERILARLGSLDLNQESALSSAPLLTIPVRYGGAFGPDLAAVCETLNLPPVEFIEQHTSRLHTVDMIGFTPGFAYLSGLPEHVRVPRLSTPRARVPAGSIGISTTLTGLYAIAGPGGWPLIGRTEMALFDPDSAAPFRLEPGQTVQFDAV